MKHLLKYYKPYILTIILVVIILFAQVMAELSLPRLMANIIDYGIIPGNISYIYKTGVFMLFVSLLGVLCACMVSYLSSKVSSKSSRQIRRALFEKITSFSNVEFDKFSTASLITRSTNDVQIVQNTSVMLFRLAFFAPIMGIGALFGAYTTSPSLSWTIWVGLTGIVILILFVLYFTMPKFKLVQDMLDKLTLIMNERLNGILVIRAFNRELDEELRFDKANLKLTNLNRFVNRAMSVMMPALILVMNLSSVLIVWAGSHLIDLGTLQIGNMLAFIQYSMSVIMSFLFISMMFIMIPKALVSAQRIGEVISSELSIMDKETTLSFDNHVTECVVEFQNVSFKYPGADENVLSNISFSAMPGETTAFIGSTGSGKSTIVNLIPRFYDVTEGKILLNNVDIRNLAQHELRSHIGYVPQKAVLFSGTINSNIAYGNEKASTEEILKASETSQSTEFINEKALNYETLISQGGTNVSGGQKQRLSIARALAINPEILIFDDSFSALDFMTDAKLRKSLKESNSNATILIVAQRINTIIHADQIIVIEDGMIAGKGKHEDLMVTCPVYKEIALSQLSESEIKRGELDINE